MPIITSDTIGSIRNAKRIISVVPSETELLYDLELDNEVVGITKFCIHPETWFRSKKRIGGTKQLNIEAIRELQPDLILANKEENVKEQVEALAVNFPVYLNDVNDLDAALEMIKIIGELTGKKDKAIEIATHISKGFTGLELNRPLLKACYLIWKDPYMTIGADTFINNMMNYAGFENVFSDQQRYPEIDVAAIKRSGCEILLLSSEPYPFKDKHINELHEQLPGVEVILVDGEMFSWYGSRLLKAPAYFKELRDRL